MCGDGFRGNEVSGAFGTGTSLSKDRRDIPDSPTTILEDCVLSETTSYHLKSRKAE